MHRAWAVLLCAQCPHHPAAMHRASPPHHCHAQGLWATLQQCRSILCSALCIPPAQTCSPVLGQPLLPVLPWASGRSHHLIHPGSGKRGGPDVPLAQPGADAGCSDLLSVGRTAASSRPAPSQTHDPLSTSIPNKADPILGSPSASAITGKLILGTETSVPACSWLSSYTHMNPAVLQPWAAPVW